ncbi:hypothetical protein EDB19DRAFT_1915252 [Suillus lakei]|nr:hypothetical protein EDB19DRAFT_1915252 [Suillus lakei]
MIDSPLSDYVTELEQLDVSADDAHSVSDHRSGSADRSSPLLYFPSSNDDNTEFNQQHTPPPSSSPPLYFCASDYDNAAPSDDDCSVLSLTFNSATCNHTADEESRINASDEELLYTEDLNDEDHWVPENDPQFLPNDALFEENTCVNSDEPDSVVPPALSEHQALLNGYVHIFANAACRCATHADAEETHNLLHSMITSCYPGRISPELKFRVT